MLAKILGAALGAKATALSAALIVAGTFVGTSASVSPDAPAQEVDQPVLVVTVSAAPTSVPQRTPEPPRRVEAAPPTSAPAAPLCDAAADTRAAARRSVDGAYTADRAALEHLRAERTGAKATDALAQADGLLQRIAQTADRILSEIAPCSPDTADVAARSVHAMDMIVDLARSATTPTATPRPTARPKPTRRGH